MELRPLAVEVLAVEVVYALPGEQAVIALELKPGTSLRQAIEHSGLLARFPEIDLAQNPIGVFGVSRALNTPARAGDRIEIYRALKSDPKDRRRQRAQAARPRSDPG